MVFKCQLQIFQVLQQILDKPTSILLILTYSQINNYTLQMTDLYYEFIIIMNIFLKFQGENFRVEETEARQLLKLSSLYRNDLFITSEGKILHQDSQLQNQQTLQIHLKLFGGKGGFGNKLKTQGGKKVRPNDNMFSRDLQGQPVSYATITRQYEQYYRQKLQADQKVSKDLADFKIAENTYREDYVSTKLDSKYNAEMQQNQKRLQGSMKIGLKKYLEKKKQEKQRQKQSYCIQNDKDFVQQSSEKENIAKQDKQDKQHEEQKQQNLKRSRPNQQQLQENDKMGQPKKKVKPNQQELRKQAEQPQQTEIINEQKKLQIKKQAVPKVMSAKQKLKSLFRK